MRGVVVLLLLVAAAVAQNAPVPTLDLPQI